MHNRQSWINIIGSYKNDGILHLYSCKVPSFFCWEYIDRKTNGNGAFSEVLRIRQLWKGSNFCAEVLAYKNDIDLNKNGGMWYYEETYFIRLYYEKAVADFIKKQKVYAGLLSG